MMPALSQEITVATNIARQAGAVLREHYQAHEPLQITHKSEKDLVTATDILVEQLVTDAITRVFPDDGITGEETGGVATTGARQWIIDPIDGTTNFIRRIPFFAVSIGLVISGQPAAGVVYNPILDELYCAVRGEGAFLNGKKLHVTPIADLAQALVITGFACLRANRQPNNLANFMTIAPQTLGIRRLGAASLDLCAVASGRAEAFWELYLKPWDVAAGGLVVEEAGGMVTDFAGGSDWLHADTLLASNGAIHTTVRGMLQCG
ncbi:MAG TPA: inositol monophosphatase family protein [bacterium]|nr:inositol monophosphatase family protein [bacterium]